MSFDLNSIHPFFRPEFEIHFGHCTVGKVPPFPHVTLNLPSFVSSWVDTTPFKVYPDLHSYLATSNSLIVPKFELLKLLEDGGLGADSHVTAVLHSDRENFNSF